MPSHNEPVQPASFEVAEPAATETNTATASPPSGGRWIVPALAALVVTALLVVFWLPGKIDPVRDDAAENVPAKASAPASTPKAPPANTAPETLTEQNKTPWADAQQARLRLQAQDVLAELLDVQFALEEQGVEIWAPGPYADAAAKAAEGDRLYRSQDYEQATTHYTEALESLAALRDSIPETLAARLQETRSAIASGDIAQANTALAAAASISPEHEDIPALQARLNTLPQVLEKLALARKSEEQGELDAAAALLEESLQLDPLHRSTAQALDRIRAAQREREFQTAMSRGYALLAEARFQPSRDAFHRAIELRPDSAEAKSALLEVETAATTNTLATLQRRGDSLEREERWQDAVEVYEQALQLDASVLYASEGLARARERAALDKQFRTILQEPERLAEVAVAEEASDFLRHAREIPSPGKVLQSQISSLEELLRLANTPVEVLLLSDMETEVTVYKVARLGKFQRRELSLRPGEYRALGTRVGYRDVHVQFSVSHEESPAPLTVVCSEPI